MPAIAVASRRAVQDAEEDLGDDARDATCERARVARAEDDGRDLLGEESEGALDVSL